MIDLDGALEAAGEDARLEDTRRKTQDARKEEEKALNPIDDMAQRVEFQSRCVPEDFVVHAVVAVSENVAHGNDSIARWDLGERVWGEIAQSVKSLANDLKLPFKNELQRSVGEEVRQGLSCHEAIDFRDRGENVVTKGLDLMRHKQLAWFLQFRV